MKRLDFINVAALLLSLAGVILEVVGGAVLSVPTGIGMNLNLSPLIFIGLLLMTLGLATAIVGTVLTEKRGLNKPLSTLALYVSVIAIMFAIVFLVLTIVMPVLRPSNG